MRTGGVPRAQHLLEARLLQVEVAPVRGDADILRDTGDERQLPVELNPDDRPRRGQQGDVVRGEVELGLHRHASRLELHEPQPPEVEVEAVPDAHSHAQTAVIAGDECGIRAADLVAGGVAEAVGGVQVTAAQLHRGVGQHRVGGIDGHIVDAVADEVEQAESLSVVLACDVHQAETEAAAARGDVDRAELQAPSVVPGDVHQAELSARCVTGQVDRGQLDPDGAAGDVHPASSCTPLAVPSVMLTAPATCTPRRSPDTKFPTPDSWTPQLECSV